MYDFHARAPCEDWEAPHVVQPPTGTPRWHPARGSAALTQVTVHLVRRVCSGRPGHERTAHTPGRSSLAASRTSASSRCHRAAAASRRTPCRAGTRLRCSCRSSEPPWTRPPSHLWIHHRDARRSIARDFENETERLPLKRNDSTRGITVVPCHGWCHRRFHGGFAGRFQRWNRR